MAGDIKLKYPATSTVALTISLASLASDSALLAGRESTAVDNTSNVDLDHLIGGKVRAGTSPTAGGILEVWAYAAYKMATGTPTYPDVLDGTDSNETLTSERVKLSMLRRCWSTTVDATTGRDYFMPPVSIARLFGALPPFWGLFVVHSMGVALDSTGSNHEFVYHRIQQQYT